MDKTSLLAVAATEKSEWWPLRVDFRSILGQLLISFWSVSVKNDPKPTENRVRTDPLQDLDTAPIFWKKGKDLHPQDMIQHLDFTKDPRPLYYKTRPCVFTTKMSVVRPFSVLSKDDIGP